MAVNETAAGYSATEDKPAESSTVERVTIEVAHNGGYIVECSYRTPKGRPSDKPSPYIGPSRKVFTDLDSLNTFLAKALGKGSEDQDDEVDANDTGED